MVGLTRVACRMTRQCWLPAWERGLSLKLLLKKTHVELRPDNKAFKTVKYGFGEVMIQGKVVGVQRGPDQFG